MKHLIPILLLYTYTFNLHLLSAAVPLRWTVETSRAQPATFEAYQGETLDFEATLQSYGKPLEAPVQYAFYWQTNGMGSTYWSAPCTVPGASSPRGADTNTLRATWTPAYDVGARAYNCFIGLSNSIYHAAFQLRLRPSPGAVPNELPLPTPVIDFARVTVLNPPWSGGGSGGVDTNAVTDIALTPATNYTDRATGEVIRLVGALADEKRDKTDLNVYAYNILTPGRFGKDFVFTPNEAGYRLAWRIGEFDDPEWAMIYYYDEYGIWVYTGSDDEYTIAGSPDDLVLSFAQIGTFTRSLDPNAGSLATTRQLPASSQLLTPEQAVEIVKVKDKADEFTAWAFEPDLPDGWTFEFVGTHQTGWAPFNRGVQAGIPYGEMDSLRVDYPYGDWDLTFAFTATRKRVLRTGDAATPQELTDAISTNNPAFVSAVQSISPPSLPSLRLYDAARDCYWIGRMVNGVISWEVEE